jgi:FkbM family methyltransferase
MFRALADKAQRLAARSRALVATAIRIRNQCEAVIGYSVQSGTDIDSNGEGLVLATVGPSCRYFVDIGANRGAWTQCMLEQAPHDCHGLLVEPSSSAFADLGRRFGSHPGIGLRQAAAGREPGRAAFYEEASSGHTSSLVRGFSHSSARPREVEVTTLDRELQRLGWPVVDFVKIDAEGYDFAVLLGARDSIRSSKIRFIQFEYNGPWAEAGATLAAALDFLSAHDYHVYLLKREGLYRFPYQRYGEYFRYSNFLAVPAAEEPSVAPLIREPA